MEFLPGLALRKFLPMLAHEMFRRVFLDLWWTLSQDFFPGLLPDFLLGFMQELLLIFFLGVFQGLSRVLSGISTDKDVFDHLARI